MEHYFQRALGAECLSEKISRRVMAGKEGALRIFSNRDAEARGPRLWRNTGSWHVPYLRIALTTGDKIVDISEDTLQGEFLIDDRGDGDCTLRFALLDRDGKVLASTEESVFNGSALIVAVPEKKDAEPFVFLAIFQRGDETTARSAAMWDCSKDWLFFANMVQEMLKEKGTWDA